MANLVRSVNVLVIVALTACSVVAFEGKAAEKSADDSATRSPANSQVKLDVKSAHKVMKSGKKDTTWIRVGLDGFKLDSDRERTPVNVALVLDKSGSMQGRKLERAREAAIKAIQRLQPNDIVSVITYDSTVNVLVPATKLTDREYVIAAINRIQAAGGTALFAGVSKGAAEIRKFADDKHVNRVVLLSDGMANVGPKTPAELGDFGASLKKENISVTTLGLGLSFNEDLMIQLASNSGGNHEFIEDAGDLAGIFNREFDSVTSVVAQQVELRISVPEGIRPVRVLGNDAEINGQKIFTKLSAIYSEQNKHVVVELEVPETGVDSKRDLASVTVSYLNMKTELRDTLTGRVSINFSDDEKAVSASRDSGVMADVAAMVANENNKLATKYLDQGNLAACRKVLSSNNEYLEFNAKEAPTNVKLQTLLDLNAYQLKQVEGKDTNRARKSMRASQVQVGNNQKLQPAPKGGK